MRCIVVLLALLSFFSNAATKESFIDKGQFKYVLYSGVDDSIVEHINHRLTSKTPQLITDFKVKEMPAITVRIWKDRNQYLAYQKHLLGQSYPWSTGYISENEILLRDTGSQSTMDTAYHEYVHLVTTAINPNIINNPRWLWEAIACYEAEKEYGWRKPSTKEEFRQYAKILKEGNGWDSQGAVYHIGYSIGEFIQQSYGSDGLITLIQTNGDISKVTDKPLEQVFDEWIEFTENKYY
ncbi:hypothetical protein [Vibrio rotiferianus]|jgi:hypothetical protein|uniref:hypothetical protein n=1 Tax=Vibrio rotiferianus TaxID=190895 RepID=UPI0038B25E2D